jgi:hypothetical protein
MAMSDTRDLEALQNQLNVQKSAVEALRAQYEQALEELRVALRQQAELQSRTTKPDGNAPGSE